MYSLSERLKALVNAQLATHIYTQLEDSPLTLIERLEPDVLVVGNDYALKDVVGRHMCKVEIIPRLPGFSSTAIFEKKTDAK